MSMSVFMMLFLAYKYTPGVDGLYYTPGVGDLNYTPGVGDL